MKIKYHILIVFVLLLGLIIEIFPFGLASAITGIFVIMLSAAYLFYLAKKGLRIGFILVIIMQFTAMYMFAKPYLHYDVSQYKDGKLIGKPHVHRIWEAGHVH